MGSLGRCGRPSALSPPPPPPSDVPPEGHGLAGPRFDGMCAPQPRPKACLLIVGASTSKLAPKIPMSYGVPSVAAVLKRLIARQPLQIDIR